MPLFIVFASVSPPRVSGPPTSLPTVMPGKGKRLGLRSRLLTLQSQFGLRLQSQFGLRSRLWLRRRVVVALRIAQTLTLTP